MSRYLSAQFCARLFTGFTLVISALTTIGLYNGALAHTWLNFDYVSQFAFMRIPLVVLIGIFALWLMLGIRTRIIAFASLVLVTILILFDVTAPVQVSGLTAIWEFGHATAFLFSLLLLTLQGGGETALVRGGWEGLL